jgi:hypothetical protein
MRESREGKQQGKDGEGRQRGRKRRRQGQRADVGKPGAEQVFILETLSTVSLHMSCRGEGDCCLIEEKRPDELEG